MAVLTAVTIASDANSSVNVVHSQKVAIVRSASAPPTGWTILIMTLLPRLRSRSGWAPEIGEAAYLGLTTAPSIDIKPPRLADAPYAMECKTWQVINVKDERQLVVGEGLRFHLRDELWDPDAMRVHMERYHPVGRMFADRYCRTNDRFQFPAGPVVKPKAVE
jgi:flavin reductase (DIM6/NTAB) family NADH-FMN oxidoreductase RutF